jgi:hypothetical protein
VYKRIIKKLAVIENAGSCALCPVGILEEGREHFGKLFAAVMDPV